jgi:hypothetical protein
MTEPTVVTVVGHQGKWSWRSATENSVTVWGPLNGSHQSFRSFSPDRIVHLQPRKSSNPMILKMTTLSGDQVFELQSLNDPDLIITRTTCTWAGDHSQALAARLEARYAEHRALRDRGAINALASVIRKFDKIAEPVRVRR